MVLNKHLVCQPSGCIPNATIKVLHRLHELRYTCAYRQCEGANQPMVDILICCPQPLHLSSFPLCSGLAQLVPETEGDGDDHLQAELVQA